MEGDSSKYGGGVTKSSLPLTGEGITKYVLVSIKYMYI